MTDETAPATIWAWKTQAYGAIQIGAWGDSIRHGMRDDQVQVEYIRADVHRAALATARADGMLEAASIANDYTPEKHKGSTLASHITGHRIETAILAAIDTPAK